MKKAMTRRTTVSFAAVAALKSALWTPAARSESHDHAYKDASGPFAASSAPALVFRVDDQGKDLGIRVTFPTGRGPFPVVVFSHGASSSKDLYNPIADHWASHGYATILPTHLDSESLGYSVRNPLPRDTVFMGRINDLHFIFDHLEEIAQKVGVEGGFDLTRAAVGGHSFGGWTALNLAGLPVAMPDGRQKSFAHPLVKALVAYNGIGPLPAIDQQGWRQVAVPVFAVTGTHDPGGTGDGLWRHWRWRIGAFDYAGSRERYALWVDGADHYWGGLICRMGAGGPPDPEGLAMANGTSTAFLDAILKNDSKARRFLVSTDFPAITGGRGFLEQHNGS